MARRAASDPPLLTRRALGRATLARQLLLARATLAPARAIERLAGLQAQAARPPYLGLWTRLEGFTAAQLTRALVSGAVVKATLMRATLHLVSAGDYVWLRPALQPALAKLTTGILRGRAKGLDPAALAGEARRQLASGPRTFEELRALLAARFPGQDDRAMGYAVRLNLPLVVVPTGTPWGFAANAPFTLAEDWLGAPIGTDESPDTLVVRYLAAFGPASATDAQAWSGRQGLAGAFDALRPKLRAFTDERGRELFDLPRAPRPDEATAAPVRFLPDYDNLLLAHDDRTRVVATEHRPRLVTKNLRVLPAFLVDGLVAGTWEVERKGDAATLVVEPFAALDGPTRDALAREGDALLRFVEADAEKRSVRFPKPTRRS